MDDADNVILCSTCDTGVKAEPPIPCPAGLFFIADEDGTVTARYALALEDDCFDVVDGCDCCVECRIDCQCDDITWDDDDDDYPDWWDDEEDEPWDSTQD